MCERRMASRAACCVGLFACVACASASVPNAGAPAQLSTVSRDTSDSVRPRSVLAVAERIAIYEVALRAAASQVFGPGVGPRLLLDPRPPIQDTTGTPNRDLVFEFTTPLDSAVVQALAASGAVEGTCWPGPRQGVCANDRRGLAAHLGPIVPKDPSHVSLKVFVNTVIATADRTWVTGGYLRVIELRLVRRNGLWEIAP